MTFDVSCLACDKTCGTCKNNSNVCTSCDGANRELVNGSCVCAPGHVSNKDTGDCSSCHASCDTCTGPGID